MEGKSHCGPSPKPSRRHYYISSSSSSLRGHTPALSSCSQLTPTLRLLFTLFFLLNLHSSGESDAIVITELDGSSKQLPHSLLLSPPLLRSSSRALQLTGQLAVYVYVCMCEGVPGVCLSRSRGRYSIAAGRTIQPRRRGLIRFLRPSPTTPALQTDSEGTPNGPRHLLLLPLPLPRSPRETANHPSQSGGLAFATVLSSACLPSLPAFEKKEAKKCGAAGKMREM